MVGKKPEYDVMLRGEEFAKNRFRYHKIGAAWNEDNGASITIDFPAAFTITPGMKLRLFERREED